MPNRIRPRPLSGGTLVAFAVALAVVLFLALFPVFPRQFNIRVGDVASRTVKSPRSVTFESPSKLKAKQEEAAKAVPDTLVFDPSVRAAQLQSYDEETARISEVRSQNTDIARKRDALTSLSLSARSLDTALTLSDDRWQAVVSEGRRLLTAELSASLDDAAAAAARTSIDSKISVDFTADQALLTAELVRPLLKATLTVDQERTAQAREAASKAVPPQLVSVAKDEVILSPDAPVDALTVEKLKAVGLISKRIEWHNVLAAMIIAAAAAAALAAYLFVLQPRGITSGRHLIAIATMVALPVLIAKFYLPLVLPDEHRYFLAYILPLAAAPILIAALLETDVAVVLAGVIGVLAAFISAFLPSLSIVATVGPLDTLRLMLVYGVAPMTGVFLVHNADRLNRYLTSGIAVAVSSYAVLVATWFIDVDRRIGDLGWMAFASGMNGVTAGVVAAGAFVTVGVLFGVTTRIQLMELSQLNAPLMRRLQDEAPGTFHHSIIVGNLAERAADLIGADSLLTRVGCYYHDVGKALQPGMYVENIQGDTPHEQMTPVESAAIIKAHVSGGVELAKRARLPSRVTDFIPEHHGTRLVAFFYRRAAEKNPDVDPAPFQYPGPKPQSRETAIVMLADSTEAMIRSSPDRSPGRIDQLVEEVIAERLSEGQLDESDLTLRDLRTIAESFKTTMRAVYHPRVQYPEPTPMESRRRMGLLSLRPPSSSPMPPLRRRKRDR
jgi:putative nucleotidyltransferase with HDIG domain